MLKGLCWCQTSLRVQRQEPCEKGYQVRVSRPCSRTKKALHPKKVSPSLVRSFKRSAPAPPLLVLPPRPAVSIHVAAALGVTIIVSKLLVGCFIFIACINSTAVPLAHKLLVELPFRCIGFQRKWPQRTL